ncbi:ead/Ea22-like family protein [Enterobacter hormaechei]|uniref:ead/Ea22-like family protein n=1 Tax=Enterobacter hormaechei TaxID=158836 RepID=UPI00339D052F
MSNIDKHIDKQALRDSAESTINILENIAGFEPSDIDGDTVELRFETEDGFDTGCDVSIVDQCQKAADVVQALLDELEAKDSTIATQQQEIRTLLNALGQSSEKRNSDLPDQKRIIGWRASDYTDETSDPELAKNWAAAIGVLPIFEGDVNTKLSAAAAGKGEAS